MPNRALQADVDTVVQRVLRELQGDGDFYGPPMNVTFPVSGSSVDVTHGLGVIPDGVDVVFADGSVYAVPGKLWTTTTAYLQASANNVHAILRFRLLRQRPA